MMVANQFPKISSMSAVFPAYNDGGTIATMVITAIMTMRQFTQDYEVIVTDDGSDDYTLQILEELANQYPCIHLIHHPHNLGYGYAIRSGFSMASKEWVFYTDGDAQYNPLELSELVKVLTDDFDVVNGYKISRGDSLTRKLVGKLYNRLFGFVFGIRIRDVNCDFRLINASYLQKINFESTDGTFGLELVKKLQDSGARFCEVPVHHYPRSYGNSQFFNFRHLFKTTSDLLKLWWKLMTRVKHRADHNG